MNNIVGLMNVKDYTQKFVDDIVITITITINSYYD